MTHYVDVIIKDPGLARELFGRLLWVVHGICARPSGDKLNVDFPGYQAYGLGYTFRVFGSETVLAEFVSSIEPLTNANLVSPQVVRSLPERVAGYAISYRQSSGDSRKRSPSAMRRLARRAVERGEPVPEYPLTQGGGLAAKSAQRHTLVMRSFSTAEQGLPREYSMAIGRRLLESHQDQIQYQGGRSYGLGGVVPVISAAEALNEAPGQEDAHV